MRWTAWNAITIYHLLTHTSGIPNFTGFSDYRPLAPFATTPEALIARFRDKPLDFAPGEKFSYSNSGYVLLGYLIEKITGGSYDPKDRTAGIKGGEKHPFKPGDVVVIPPGTAHWFSKISGHVTYIQVRFPGNVLEKEARRAETGKR